MIAEPEQMAPYPHHHRPAAGCRRRDRHPTGVAHQNLGSSDDFGVVGAYPDGRNWDVLRGRPGDRPAVDRNTAAVPVPMTDPLGGTEGPLVRVWRR